MVGLELEASDRVAQVPCVAASRGLVSRPDAVRRRAPTSARQSLLTSRPGVPETAEQQRAQVPCVAASRGLSGPALVTMDTRRTASEARERRIELGGERRRRRYPASQRAGA